VRVVPGMLTALAKMLVMVGLVLALLGAVLWVLGQVPYIGHLPGDIYIKRGNFSFYFPLATCILLSIVLTLLFSLMRR